MERRDWIIKIKNELDSMVDISTEVVHWNKRSIYRVPASVIDLNKKVYKPQIVSLGPYHHGDDHLKAMEEHKDRALLHFLKRSRKSIECYVDALAEKVDDLKDAYDQLDSKWQLETDQGFLELMVLDGCFILEILRTATQTLNDYAPNDPIFSTHGKLHIVPYLKRDMLMLENQLPLLVLEKLVAVEKENSKREEKIVSKLILDFFSQKPVRNMGKCLHILDMYRKSLLGEPPQKKHHEKSHRKTNHRGDEIIRSAAELNEAGIRIKKSKTKSLKDISFRGGVLKLPQIVVDDNTESMYLNLIAFERLHVGTGNEVTAYIFFMDNIIDSARDVSLLHSSGIIQNAIGSDKAVAKLFNSLSKDVTLDPESRLDEVRKKVSYYCKKPWNAWRADIMHNYFRNPWAILSVFAAIFLFALTIIQTVYGVLSYVHP